LEEGSSYNQHTPSALAVKQIDHAISKNWSFLLQSCCRHVRADADLEGPYHRGNKSFVPAMIKESAHVRIRTFVIIIGNMASGSCHGNK
jgi:hypothetical protein